MEKEARLRYSLAIAVSLTLIFNACLVWLARAGHPLIANQDALPIGIKWLILLVVGVLSFGIAFWAHRAFLDAEVSPMDTTWVDFVVIGYALLTMVALLFVGEGFWLLLGVFLTMLFVFSAFVLKRLLESLKGWLAWLLVTLVLSVLLIIFISTLSIAS